MPVFGSLILLSPAHGMISTNIYGRHSHLNESNLVIPESHG